MATKEARDVCAAVCLSVSVFIDARAGHGHYQVVHMLGLCCLVCSDNNNNKNSQRTTWPNMANVVSL